MPLGTAVGLGAGDIVLHGDPALLTERGTAAPPTFRPMSIVAKRLPISATAELCSVNISSERFKGAGEDPEHKVPLRSPQVVTSYGPLTMMSARVTTAMT